MNILLRNHFIISSHTFTYFQSLLLSNPSESSYEYYIHYENENRRWDEWVTLEKLKPTDERIPDEPKRQQQKAKANDFNEYDEHEGFD